VADPLDIHNLPFHECNYVTALHRLLCRMSESGQFLPPSLATAMEELASTPDAEAHNRYASF
jgi:hypothetical protein